MKAAHWQVDLQLVRQLRLFENVAASSINQLLKEFRAYDLDEGEILLSGTTFRFDGSDLMPGAVGAGSFWTGMVDFVGGKSAQEVADQIQSSWDAIK